MNKFEPRPFEPPEEQLRLLPEISGNALNGLGELAPRRPLPIYWHRADKIPHGRLMTYMVDRFNAVPEFKAIYADRAARGAGAVVPVAKRREEDEGENWSARVKAFAGANDADLVGIAGADPEWVFEGYEGDNLPWIVVLGIAMDYDRLAAATGLPEDPTSALEVADKYNKGARASRALANWIQGRGWRAVAHAGPWAGNLTLIPPALAAGLGELGKHGSIINDEFGSSFRLAAVTTDLPLCADAPWEFGADEFCLNCRSCTDACPPDAIFRDKQTVRGAKKWYVDFDKCIPYFNHTHGCGICIAACPWSRPGVAPRLAGKLARRRRRLEAGEGS